MLNNLQIYGICLAKPNLAREIYYALSNGNVIEFTIEMNVQTIFIPYHKH